MKVVPATCHSLSLSLSLSLYMYIYIYIYICIEREREICVVVYVYVFVIERERFMYMYRERERDLCLLRGPSRLVRPGPGLAGPVRSALAPVPGTMNDSNDMIIMIWLH